MISEWGPKFMVVTFVVAPIVILTTVALVALLQKPKAPGRNVPEPEPDDHLGDQAHYPKSLFYAFKRSRREG